MRRSLRRQIERRINQTWAAQNCMERGTVGVALIFPKDAFADAPAWTPGPGFRALSNESISNSAFIRDNGDGTETVVVGGIGPAQRPGRDGGVWTEEEVWTVTAPTEAYEYSGIGNNTQGITSMLDQPEAVIHREPYEGHPLETLENYWENFANAWGFMPEGELRYEGGWPFGVGREWAYLVCHTNSTHDEGNQVVLLDSVVKLADLFSAEVRVYPYNLQKREITGPLGNTIRRAYIRDVKNALRK
ncbi:hypothetical protein [Streptomyces sp. NPDC088775]|uniref:hypothetical protein n=1 Tax=Streptomyces sp. NPDC088775 TaxID=3365896 RepID=UPI0038149735